MAEAVPSAPTPQRRRSGVVVPNAPRWYQWVLAGIIWLLVKLVSLTIRYQVHDPHHVLKAGKLPLSIYCIWHNRVVLCVEIYRRFARPPSPARGLAGMVSASKDGALLAAIFRCLGVRPVRGSSSRRGAQALRELNTAAEQGYDLAITPDGPRGPRYQVADGAVALAQLTGQPLLPASYRLSWKLTLKSWDRMLIPLPFSRCEVEIGEPFTVPRELSEEAREQYRQRLEQELRRITRED